MLDLNFFIVSHFVIAVVAVLLGFSVLRKDIKNPVNRSFGFLSLGVVIWSFSYGVWLLCKSQEAALFWSRTLNMGATLIPVFYINWILNVLGKKRKKTLIFYYLITSVFLLFSYSKHYISGTKEIFYFIFFPQAGWLYITFLVVGWLSLILYGIILLLKELRHATGVYREQIKYVLFGSILGFLGGSTNFPLMMGKDWFPPLGSPLVVAYSVVFGYSIIVHHLMDIRLVLRKWTVFILTLFSALGIAFGVRFVFNKFFVGHELFSEFTILAVVIFLLPNIKDYFQNVSNRYFFTSLYDSNALITGLGDKLKSTLDPNKIYNIIFSTINDAFHVKSMLTLVKDRDNDFIVEDNFNSKIDCKKLFFATRSLYRQNGKDLVPVIVEELKRENSPKKIKSIQLLESYKIAALSPLGVEGQVTGLIALGEKESGDMYNDEDINVLNIVGTQATIAIENALLYKEIGEMNKNLQKKVEEKTGELRKQNEYLEKLLIMRSEFLDIASHQLRTPVSVIKGMISMILEGGLAKEKVDEFLKAVLFKSNKLAEIINDILRASEMDTENVLLKFSKVDLNVLLTKLIEDKQIQIKNSGIKLSLNLPAKPLPILNADDRYLEQAIGNLVNNSIQYTPKGGKIDVDAKVNGKNVEIRVIDTGIGIPKEDMPKLFSKFSRAKNAIAMYTDGTGLGLFIVKKIVEGHIGGKICIEKTEEGKGSTFLITLAGS
ncbi:MAG: ATP-binding protein [Patescibacteria group bacterium]|jgi:signal transduction histidine kinase